MSVMIGEFHFNMAVITLSALRQFYSFFSLALTGVHSYAIISWTMQEMNTNWESTRWPPSILHHSSRIISDTELTVRCVLNRPKWPLLGVASRNRLKTKVQLISTGVVWLGRSRGSGDRRVDGRLTHVGFIRVGAPTVCWWNFKENKSLDST
jgi:hypothetical protein